MRTITSFFILLFLSVTSNAQNREKAITQIEQTIISTLNAKDLKDSIAFYAVSIQIEIKKKNGKAVVNKIAYNDTIAKVIFPNLDQLKKIDYTPFIINKRNAIINIPIVYIIANLSNNDISEKKISLSGLQDNIYKLFNCNKKEACITDNVIYLKPIIITVDRAIYD